MRRRSRPTADGTAPQSPDATDASVMDSDWDYMRRQKQLRQAKTTEQLWQLPQQA